MCEHELTSEAASPMSLLLATPGMVEQAASVGAALSNTRSPRQQPPPPESGTQHGRLLSAGCPHP